MNKENGLLKNVQLTNGPDGKIDQGCASDHDCCIVLIISIKSSKQSLDSSQSNTIHLVLFKFNSIPFVESS